MRIRDHIIAVQPGIVVETNGIEFMKIVEREWRVVDTDGKGGRRVSSAKKGAEVQMKRDADVKVQEYGVPLSARSQVGETIAKGEVQQSGLVHHPHEGSLQASEVMSISPAPRPAEMRKSTSRGRKSVGYDQKPDVSSSPYKELLHDFSFAWNRQRLEV